MLILCEKPSVASEFAKALSCKAGKGFFLGADTVITYCVGHLYQLYMPEDYSPELKKWTLGSLPILPAEYKYKKSEGAAGQAATVSGLLQKHKNGRIIIATDAGREGELIARIALREAGLRDISRCRRFWVSEALTPEVIGKGLAEAKPLSDYNRIAAQGYARQHADWIVGINLTRYLSIGNKEVFSVGRVQSAVLAAIAARNYQAANFVPMPYNELEITLADAGGARLKAKLINPATNKTAFALKDAGLRDALDYAKKHARDLQIAADTARKSQKPDKLPNLTALQKTAYKLYGYSPDETLETAQILYERYKCISYPRTPSRVMGEGNVGLFRSKYEKLAGHFIQWSQYSNQALINEKNRHIFNSSALEDHHALIPLAAVPEGASAKEKNVYLIIVKSFFTACMDDLVWNEHCYKIRNGAYSYKAVSKEILEEGWKKAMWQDEETADGTANTVEYFDTKTCAIASAAILDKQTSPRKDFQIDSLLAFMEKPQAEEETGAGKLAGLGTPATRAEIIKTLFDRGYIAEEKKRLVATKKGLWLVQKIKADECLKGIADIERTTAWEKQMETDPAEFEKSVVSYVKSCIKKRSPGEEKWEWETVGICPLCGNKLHEAKKSYFCSAWNSAKPCKFVIWKEVAGARLSESDIRLLLERKVTPVKACESKAGKKFKAAFALDEAGDIKFVFHEPKKARKPPGGKRRR
jgi:DNA topoisomerase-3